MGDVLDVLRPQILEADIQLAVDFLEHLVRDENATRVGQGLQTRGDVDAVAVDVVSLDDHRRRD